MPTAGSSSTVGSTPNLGPDGDGEAPKDIVSEFRDFVAEKLREDDDRVEVRVTKRRAIRSRFNSKVDGFDPSVDLVVALQRRDKPGVWIPNLPEGGWDPAHPAEHTRLFGPAPQRAAARTYVSHDTEMHRAGLRT